MENKKIILGNSNFDSIVKNGIHVSNIGTLLPLNVTSVKPECLISKTIEKAKELGYTITYNGKLLKDEKIYKTKIS